MRKILVLSGALLLLIGAFLIWKQLHPPLSDEQQILANMDAVTSAVDAKQVGGIKNYLTDDFTLKDQARQDVLTNLTGYFLNEQEVTLSVSGVEVTVTGDSAVSTGHYTIVSRAETSSPPDTTVGDFHLEWRKENGFWLIAKADGGRIPGQ